jgi:hypothetical protein
MSDLRLKRPLPFAAALAFAAALFTVTPAWPASDIGHSA